MSCPPAPQRPLARWSMSELAAETQRSGLVASISGSTIWRWLHDDAIRPWFHRSWIFPRDPAFATKAGRILDLYERVWEGHPLTADDFVISADEKTSVQARHRCHATQPPRAGMVMKVEHEYTRAGAWAYLAALDVHHARLFGRCESTTGIAPVDRLVEHVMTSSPYRDARRVFWIVDNGSSHRGARRGTSATAVSESGAGARARPCQLAQSNRDLLLDRATQGPHAERLRVLGRRGVPAPGLSAALSIAGSTIRVDLHPVRLDPAARQTGAPEASFDCRMRNTCTNL